jgi:peptide/nickel transport system substrate-binding protein
MGFASIYPAEYADKLLKAGTPDKLNSQPIGTGRSSSRASRKMPSVRYKANPDYFGGKPAVDPLIFAITPDANVRCRNCAATSARSPCRPNRWMSARREEPH